VEEGLWSPDQESKLSFLERNISLMVNKKRSASVLSQIEDIEELIKGYEKDYSALYQKKHSLLNLSAESLASSATTEFMIHMSFFDDENLIKNSFSLDDVVEFSSEEISDVLSLYKDIIDLFVPINIKKVSVNDKFRKFMKMSSGAESFFGKSGYKLTLHQINLFDYCLYYTKLLERIEEISPEERQDPDEIERIFILEINKDKMKQGIDRTKVSEAFAKAKESS
jgi:hypothetical protein